MPPVQGGEHPPSPPLTSSHVLLPRSPGGLQLGYQEAGALMLLCSPLLLDENANLGTVMRYEEIGEWGWESRGGAWGAACLHHGQSGGAERLENLGQGCYRVYSQKSPKRRPKSQWCPVHLLTALAPVPRREA